MRGVSAATAESENKLRLNKSKLGIFAVFIFVSLRLTSFSKTIFLKSSPLYDCFSSPLGFVLRLFLCEQTNVVLTFFVLPEQRVSFIKVLSYWAY